MNLLCEPGGHSNSRAAAVAVTSKQYEQPARLVVLLITKVINLGVQILRFGVRVQCGRKARELELFTVRDGTFNNNIILYSVLRASLGTTYAPPPSTHILNTVKPQPRLTICGSDPLRPDRPSSCNHPFSSDYYVTGHLSRHSSS